MDTTVKTMILQALDLQIASSKRGINSKAPAFKPIYEKEIADAEAAKTWVNSQK